MAKLFGNWYICKWEKVLFSAETLIPLIPRILQQFVRRRWAKTLLPEYIILTVKYGESVKLWGCSDYSKSGSIYFSEAFWKDKNINTFGDRNGKKFSKIDW